MFEQALKQYELRGVKSAIKFLQQQDDWLAAAQSHNELMRHLYRKQKRIDEAVVVGQAGFEFAMAQAENAGNDAMAYELRSQAKALAYNLGAFTWDGWDEVGIQLTPELCAIGREMAFTNERMAQELQKGDLPLSRACWLVGAQELSASNLDQAISCFDAAAGYAEAANEAADVWLNRGYKALTQLLDEPGDRAAQSDLERAKAALADLEYGDFYIEQLDTAFRVMSAKR